MPFVPGLLKFVTDVFLETGTFQGDTIHYVNNNDICKPSKIISLELSDVFFAACTKRFENNERIHLYKGNSKYDLYNIIKDIPNKITFWLDSHWSGTPDVGCDVVTVCPVLEELEQIKNHPLNTHTIMIDDIRLMNNSDNKFIGFPVTIDQILAKLYEINPNYTIRYFNDYTAENDVLVAYVEEKRCIHKYLRQCSTNDQPPGFADFLRGTIALYNFSKQYDYTLYIDGQHPLFNCLKPNKGIVYNNNSTTEEVLPPLSYDDIYSKLNDKFASGTSFSVLTNSFYTLHEGRVAMVCGEISEDCANYMKDILSPSTEVDNKLKYVFSEVYKMDINDSFKVIHLRFGDKFIHNNIYDDTLYGQYYTYIHKLVNESNERYVLMSDSSEMAKKLKADIPDLLYWDNTKIHLGDLINIESSTVLDTMVDFFIISKCKEIITNGSGFSYINSILYNIKYTRVSM